MTRPVPKWRVIGLNPLGTILSLVGVSAALLFPWVLYKSNRVLPGVPRDLIDVLPGADVMIGTVLMVGVAAIATFCSGARLRLAAALLGLAVVAFTLAAASDALTPQGNRVVRIAPGAGFWTLLMCLILLAADAAARWRPGPAWRMLLLAGVTAVVVVGFAYGTFDHVSIMREYTINADRFRREFRQHVWLAIGPLLAALVVSLPLAIACHRTRRFRTSILAGLNLVQTVPAIALFGMLMAPLGALAYEFPRLAEFGVHGIGAAPAMIALFLYAMLPITANTVTGLDGVASAAVDAARGVGMTRWQILWGIELRLAMPVILTGVRIALVQNIGMATIAALIGAGGLGSFVFQGIGQTATDLVLLGVVPIVGLGVCAAVLFDALVDVVDRRHP